MACAAYTIGSATTIDGAATSGGGTMTFSMSTGTAICPGGASTTDSAVTFGTTNTVAAMNINMEAPNMEAITILEAASTAATRTMEGATYGDY